MASLQDQLLKSGLIDNKKAKQAEKEKRKQNKQAKKSKTPVLDEAKENARRAMQEKAEKDRELNKQRQQEAEQKAIQAQIKQLIQHHKQEKKSGNSELEYSFVDHKKIKKIVVSHTVQNRLVAGSLAIVRTDTGYELVPRIVADKISQRDSSFVVLLNDQSDNQNDDDDPYKDYEIPDDLMW